MEDYKSKLGSLADKLKKERPATPIQQVSPVKVRPDEEAEVQFNNRVPKSLLKQLKTYSLEHDQSLKEINIKALQQYLQSN